MLYDHFRGFCSLKATFFFFKLYIYVDFIVISFLKIPPYLILIFLSILGISSYVNLHFRIMKTKVQGS